MKQNDWAGKIVDKMLEEDRFSQWLGIEKLVAEQGHCILKMKVRSEMVNGFGIAHGGICFSFADSALAFASNAYGRLSVALECSISFPVAVNVGDELTCEAKELSLTNKTGVYLIEIKNQKKQNVAFFKGTVYRTSKEWFPLHTNNESATNDTNNESSTNDTNNESATNDTNNESATNATNDKSLNVKNGSIKETSVVENDKADLIFPDLSYKIIGCAYSVFNEIGGGHKEVAYHKAFGVALKNAFLSFKENIFFPVKFKNESVEKGYFDYLIDGKIVIELKSRDRFVKKDFDQLSNYLNNSKIMLGILIVFGRTE